MTKWGAVVGGLVVGLAMVAGVTGVAQARHLDSDMGCTNCHKPHKAAPDSDPAASWGVPLWNTATTSAGLPTFTLYSSDTFTALATDIGQPDGASKLCLGCHDGSYIVFQSNPTSPAIVGATDLAKSHPVSFTYDTALAARHPKHSLNDPSVALSGLGGTIKTDLLDSHNKVQCTSCHDVHTSGIGTYMLRYDYNTSTHTDGTMCRICHSK
jgi:hypothetical protein